MLKPESYLIGTAKERHAKARQMWLDGVSQVDIAKACGYANYTVVGSLACSKRWGARGRMKSKKKPGKPREESYLLGTAKERHAKAKQMWLDGATRMSIAEACGYANCEVVACLATRKHWPRRGNPVARKRRARLKALWLQGLSVGDIRLTMGYASNNCVSSTISQMGLKSRGHRGVIFGEGVFEERTRMLSSDGRVKQSKGGS